MTTAPATKTPAVDTQSILRDGSYFILDDYALRDEFYPKVVDAFFEAIEKTGGADVRRKVEAVGLPRMHEHFPASKLLLLDNYLHEKLNRDLYYWSFRVGRDDLGLDGTFYVDALIVMRVYYPFLVSRETTNVERPKYRWRERARQGTAAVRNPRLVANYLTRGRASRRKKQGYNPEQYHQSLPEVARAHGAHIDTWYGHSYDGLNLWWAIDGVNEGNTVILYPGMFGYQYAYDPTNMYLAEGVPVTKPHKLVLDPGQLLVFNPEVLHGTQVNISDQTRVVISTRLNPGQPRFELNAAWNFEHWYSSDDLERKRFSSVTVFPAKDNMGKPSFEFKPGLPAPETRQVDIAAELNGVPQRVCAASELGEGQKIAVDFDNAKVMLLRVGGKIRALNRICPHLSFDMRAAYHDEKALYCPGHGVAYGLEDGTSACAAFAVERYEAWEEDGSVFLQRRPRGASDDLAETP
jgi:nitrite reductase/ring-hydroxylating ferredoxin subunit